MDAKEAFKLGFCLKLAQEGIDPSDLTEKKAIGAVVGPLAATALPLAAFGTLVAPGMAGKTVGGMASHLQDDNLPTSQDERRMYTIHRLQRLIERQKAKNNNRLISSAIQEA